MAVPPPPPDVRRFETSTGVRIYRISSEAFPGLVVHVYLLLEAGVPTLVDAGSGFGESTAQILAGIEQVRTDFGESVTLDDIRRIIITHGHIDHFGGLAQLHERMPRAEIAIHQLDARILTAFEERVAVAKKGLRQFLEQAGVGASLLQGFLDVYGYSKRNMRSLPVTHTLADHQQWDGMEFVHTPGHCPGQVCIQIGDVLLSADHVLPEISPHQAPESIMPYTGLGHYLDSLYKVSQIEGIRLTLGGHQGPIHDLYRRASDIRQSHERKLEKILGIIRQAPQPMTVNEISQQLYVHVKGFHVLLAIEEVAAHVEYLYQHNRLAIANLDQYQSEDNPPIRYVQAGPG